MKINLDFRYIFYFISILKLSQAVISSEVTIIEFYVKYPDYHSAFVLLNFERLDFQLRV